MIKKDNLKSTVNGLFALFLFVKVLLIFILFMSRNFLSFFIENYTEHSSSKILNDLFSYNTLSGLLIMIVIPIISLFIPTCLYLYLSKSKYEDVVKSRKPTVLEVLCTIGTTIFFANIASALTQIILSLFKSIFNIPYVTYETQTPTNIYLIPLFIIVIAVMPGLLEEFLMRGVALNKLHKFGNGFTVFISAFVFSMLHNTIEQMLFAFVAGLFLGIYAIKFESMWVAVLGHFVLNFYSAIVQLFMKIIDTDAGTLFYIIFMLTFSFTVFCLMITSFVLYGLKMPKDKVTDFAPTYAKMGAVFTSPFFYSFVICTLLVVGINILEMFMLRG